MRLLRAGDRAWLVELDDNESARRVARHVVAENVVPGDRTVLVVGDASEDALRDAAVRALAEPLPTGAAKTVEIPVRYDGADLADVARLARLTEDEVVARHTAPTYTVAFLGFAPGFAYLVGGDPALAVPRLDDPRRHVPAGSVAVAGPYSGVYPRASPGGWRLLGRTDVVLFDPARRDPALLEAGDRVRFVAL